MQKKHFILAMLTLFISAMYAQTPAKYWVQFKDKNNSPYSIAHPESYLSPRALEKRAKFNIAITEADLPVNEQYIKEILALDTSIVVFTKSKWMNGITIYCTQDSIISMLKSLDFVQTAERTIMMKEPENPFQSRFYFSTGTNWAVSNVEHPINDTPNLKDLNYGKAKEQVAVNNAQWLHRMGYLGEGVLLMVIDGGFHNTDSIRHLKKLRDEGRLWGVRNYVQPGEDPMRSGTHGTLVLSCIASNLPGELMGTAPMVSVYLAQPEDHRSENKVEEDNWVAAIEWADSLGCDVINSSLGYTRFEDTSLNHSKKDLNGKTSRASMAATMASERGIIPCISAGNEGAGSWHYIGIPSDAENVLCVGGVTLRKIRVFFSSYGYSADGRVKPDICATALNVSVANQFGKTTHASGTSFSSPLLAGMVCCLRQAFPDKSAYEIMQAVRESGNQYEKPDSALGYGIADMLKAYNLLLNSEDIKKSPIHISLNSYVVSGSSLLLTIHSPEASQIEVRFENSEIAPKNYKVKRGKTVIKLKKLPTIESGKPFDFAKLVIKGDLVDCHLVLGVE